MRLAPTANSGLPLNVGNFATLPEGLDYAARGETGFNFFSSRGGAVATLSYADLRERAVELARRLVGLGFPPKSSFAIAAETGPEFPIFFFACQYAGLIPVPLPLSLHMGGHGEYVARLRGMLRSARPMAAAASAESVKFLKEAAEGLDLVVESHQAFCALPSNGADLRPFHEGDPCYIQYSSGSTTEPRGVLVTQRGVTANARAIGRFGLDLRAGDRATSWLPLYHDMGLVGFCITPMLSQITVDYLATSSFALRPRLWLKLISEHRSTVSFSPTFGYDLCVRRSAKDGGAGFDLSSWRVAGVGGEMVRPETLTRFADLFSESGFDRRAFLPSYGLAEATLAVTFTELGQGMRTDVIGRNGYELQARASPAADGRNGGRSAKPERARAFVGCGRPLPGYEVTICDERARPLPERTIGCVIVAGPSLMDGYFEDPVRTSEVLHDGRLDTGDMGYLVGRELFITGRRKDMIIASGRNIWPQDLEWAVERLPGVRSGSVAAFSVADPDAEERVVLVVESYSTDPEVRKALRQDVMATVHRTAGVRCELLLVPPRSLPYTSSGKLSRATARCRFLEGVLTAAGSPSPAETNAAEADDTRGKLS